ncbi:MAG: hypothetical protein MZV70_36480 [Desulfobacterales bacterium]|nr:hypothetical protein [Desulfobacterales bacterium]
MAVLCIARSYPSSWCWSLGMVEIANQIAILARNQEAIRASPGGISPSRPPGIWHPGCM